MASSQSTPVKHARTSYRPSNVEPPMTAKISQAAASCSGKIDLAPKRKHALIELGEAVSQVSAQFFVGEGGILPPLPFTLPSSPDSVRRSVLGEVINDLKEKGILLPPSKSLPSRWKWFDLGKPSTYSDNENRVFFDIELITDAIRQSLDAVMEANDQPTREPTVVFKCNPDQVPASLTRDNKTRPDCYALLNSTPRPGLAHADAEGKPYWLSIGVPGEFKKEEEDQVKNWTQVLWSMTHMMQEDPRRRFVFAFSIEDALMRIWVASRSDVLVSLPFNFNESYEHMTEFFLRLMYAEEEELGWDTTMERLPRAASSGPFQYKINCAGVMYRTARIISDIGAEALRGRGTRVWEVVELNADGSDTDPKPLVLKDSWVDADRDREATILENIRKAAEVHGLLDGFERQFMHVRRSGDVFIGKNPVKDHTHELILRGCSRTEGSEESLKVSRKNRRVINEGKKPVNSKKSKKSKKSKESRKPKKAAEKGTAQNGPHGVAKRPANVVEKILQYESKVHHRIVFEELGRTIVQVETLSSALNVLSDAVKALQILHNCGWVHRDVSTGTILVVDGVGKLADFEYAKSEKDVSVHGVRTGTPCFMATEVESQDYLYLMFPVPNIPDSDIESDNDGDGRGGADLNSKGQDQDQNQDRSSPPPSSRNSVICASDDSDFSAFNTFSSQDGYSTRSDSDSAASSEAVPADDPAKQPFNPNDFRHNPLHDMESALWVEVWLLVCSKFVKPVKKSEEKWAEYMANHGVSVSTLFNDLHGRTKAINDKKTFKESFQKLLPEVKYVGSHLEVFRCSLRNRYVAAYDKRQDAEEQPPFAGIAQGLHGEMINQLGVTAAKLQKQKDLVIEVPARVEHRDVAPSKVNTPEPTGGSSARRTLEADRRESVQRKRQKTNDGKAIFLPATRSPRMTQMHRLPVAGPSRTTRFQTKKLMPPGQN